MSKKSKIISFILVFIGTIFYFFANFQRTAIPGAIFNILQTELSVDAPVITAFASIFMYIYAFNQLVIGVLVDKFGGFRVILFGGILLLVGATLFPLSSNIFIMYISRGLVGLGSSTFYLSMIRELREIIDEKNFGIAISIVLFLGYTGGIASNAPFVYLMKFMSWRDALITFSGILLIALILFAILMNCIKLRKINKNIKIRTLPFRLVLHKRHNRNLFSFACCNYGIAYAIQAIIGKKFLEDFCLMSTSKAAITISIMAVIGALFNVINAVICKINHNHRVQFLKNASVITFVSILLICILLVFDIRSYFIAFLFCVLAANASLSSLLVPVLHLTNRKMTSSTAVSIMNFCFFTMVGILGTAMGFMLNIFEPIKNGDTVIYTSQSYLTVFGLFLILSIFEMYKATKLSNKY